MPDIPQNILSQIVNLPHHPKLEQAFIAALDTAEGETPPWGKGSNSDALEDVDGAGKEIAFQYWPETLSDSREVAWNPRVIPGGSHPIYQWTHSGERRVSFTAVFTTDTSPTEMLSSIDLDLPESEIAPLNEDPYTTIDALPMTNIQKGARDMDIRMAISWLRYFTYPLYGEGEDLRVFEPPKVLLVLPNTGLAHNGDDHLVTVMTQCEVTYQEWFPSGFPRAAEVQLEFAEVVQSGGRIKFHSRDDMQSSSPIGSYTGIK